MIYLIQTEEKMKRKTMVRLDNDTIDSQVIQNVLTTNQKLSAIDRHIFMFEFDDTVFTHTLMLLGRNSNRFGYDLQYYLNSIGLISKNLPSEYLTLDIGSSDFKRKASEDFGVGFSSLFMVESFGISWQNISQIPQNTQFSKFTPDFVAMSGEDKYIYESKGTTQANKLSEKIDKALNQSKSYTESTTKNNFAFVSYFPNNRKVFPTFMFIADPPARNFWHMDDWHVLMLHYKNVLEYSHFRETLRIFIELLKQKIKIERLEEEIFSLRYNREVRTFENLKNQLLETFERELENLNDLDFQNLKFVGKVIPVESDGLRVRLFLGVESKVIENVLNL